MPKLSQVTKLKLQTSNAIVLICGTRNNGEAFFAYAEISKEQMQKMARDKEEGKQVDLASYGKILLSGEGKPSEADKKYMTDNYNFDHNAS